MASREEICSMGLGLIGEPPITDFNDAASRAAMFCRQFWTITLEAVLRQYPWLFATRRTRLEASDEQPAFGYSRAFALPSDCLRVWGVQSDTIAYEVERGAGGLVLLTNESEICVRYTARVNETGRFDPLFTEALACRLAAALAYPVTKNRQLAEDMMRLSEMKIPKAKQAASAESMHREAETSSWMPDAGF